MKNRKHRLTVTVDKDLIDAGSAAVDEGLAPSLSGWVNLALAERVAKERQLKALSEAISTYEVEFGTISDAELLAQEREDRRQAVVVRPPRKNRGRKGVA